MKKIYFFLLTYLFFSFINNNQAQTSLSAGDLAFYTYSADTPDEFGFVLLKDIDAATTINFTDNGWQTSGSFRANEGDITWTSGAAYTYGTIIYITSSGANKGTFTGSYPALSGSGDQLFAYQGAGTLTDLIAGMQMNGDWDADATSSNTSAQPSSLSMNNYSFAIDPEQDNAIYDTTNGMTGNADTLRAYLHDASHYITNNSSAFSTATEYTAGTIANGFSNVIASTLSASLTIDSTVSCNGLSDGGLTVTASGGTTPYSYSWSTGATGVSSLTGLVATTYYVTVTDNGGFMAIDTAIVTEPAVIVISLTPSDVACFGESTGVVSSSVSGGTASYSYLWNTGATTSGITNASAGSYTVTVTDNNSCTAVESVTIGTRPQTIISFSTTNVSCNGLFDGSIQATISGGTPSYNYNWSQGTIGSGSTTTITSLAPGTYNLTVTDALSCVTVDSTTITEPTVLVASTVVDSNVTINGGSNGGATASATGGTMPYTYLWDNATNTANITGVAAGTYLVTVTDNNGCTDVDSATITQPAALTTSFSTTMVSCNGGSDGAATVSATGGSSPYTYLWDNTITTASITGLTSGTYRVTVTDNVGATKIDSVTITEPTIISINLTVSDVACFGDSTGLINSSVFGGTSPYTYLWSTGSTSTVVTNLPAGFYTVTVTDNNGCTGVESAIIGTRPQTLISFSPTNISCNGLSDGSVQATISGGTPSYNYSWSQGSTGSGSTTAINNLTPGYYAITITDALGCTTIDSALVTEPAVLATTAIVDSNVSINGGSNGGASASVTGGTAPYSYLWSNTATTTSITGVVAGTYITTVTDNNGCTSIDSVTITEPTLLVANITVDSDESCIGFDGGLTASGTGGTSPYSYLWSNAATTASITGLNAGNYAVTITDNAGATATATQAVTTSPIPTTSAVITNVSTTGGNDGAIDLTVSGGTPAFTFLWSNAATTEDVSNLVAGNYSVTITDANSCSLTEIYSIQQPSVLANLVITEINYNGPESGADTSEFIEFVNTGSTTVNLNGYSFSQGVSHTFSSNDSITVGQYFVIAVDSSSFRNRFGMNADAIWTSGGLSNGGEDITIIDNFGRTVDSVDYDDNAPWPSGATAGRPDGGGSTIVLCDSTANNNDAANWERAVSAVGGQVVNGFQVFANPGTGATCPSPLTIVTNVNSNVTCFGQADGVAIVTAMDGLSPYVYSWSNSDTTSVTNALAAGVYYVTVTDGLGTTEVDSVIITQPDSLSISLLVTNATNNLSSDGSIAANVTGGVPPYTFLWNDPLLQSTQTATSLAAGTYCVTVTDANGCTKIACDTVKNATIVGLNDAVNNDNALKLYPNPTVGFLTIELKNNNAIEEILQVYSIDGRLIKEEFINTNQLLLDLREYENGIYIVRLGTISKRIVLNK